MKNHKITKQVANEIDVKEIEKLGLHTEGGSE